jgi:hypothetical protein
MAVPFLNSINLNKNEVENFKVFNYSGDPTLSSGGDFGYFWLDTTGSKRMKWWDGTTIRSFLDTSSTISGTQISGNITGSSGSVANALTAGTYLTGGTYNGSAAVSFAVDATSSDTVSKVVARDANGNFSGKTITATVGFSGPLTGNVTGNVVGNLTGNADTATRATSLAGGAAGRVVYQDGANSTAFLAGGTNGQVLTYNTTGPTPQWTNQSSLTAGAVANALTAGTYLTAGGTFDGSVARTFAVDATSANTASKVVARDASGNFSAGTITASLSGNATTATTADKVANALTAGSYLTAGGTFDGAAARTFAVDATSANTASKVVARDASGNFSAGTITASLSGTATRANNLSGGDAGYIPYQSSTNNTALLSLGSATQVLAVNSGGTAPEWINQSSLSAGTLSTARNFSITGKATASAVSFNGNNNVALDVTALSVAAGDISLTSGNFLVGNGSNAAQSTAKSSISLTGFGALTADLDIAGFNIINSGNVTTGSSASTLATKGYVDSVATGLQVKAFCDVATTANITLSSPGSITIDGVNSSTFTSGVTRILVKDQTTASQNGIYIWNGSSSAMTRSTDMDSWTELLSAYTFVDSGTANADSGWVCTVAAGGTLGTTAITFTKFSQAGSYTAGNGLVQSGSAFHFAQSSNYTTGQIPYASGSTTIGFKAVTGTGDVVLATNPTLITPALGTPTSGTLTSCTGLPLTTGVTGTLPVANGGTGATTFTAGRVLFGNGTSAINTSANLFWDNSNNRLGIGTATPPETLSVIGKGYFESANPDINAIKIQASTGTNAAGIQLVNTGGNYYIGADNSAGTRLAGVPYALSIVTEGAYPIVFATNNTLRATLDSYGNLGLGVTPSAVGTEDYYRCIELGKNGNGIHSATVNLTSQEFTWVTSNAYPAYSAGTIWKYGNTGGAARYELRNDEHSWHIAGSGSAGNTISFTQAMTLDASGNLGVGATPGSYRLDVKSATNSGQLRIYGADQNSITISDKAGTAAKGFLIGRSSSSDDANNFFIYDLTASQFRLEIATTGEILAGKNGTASNPVYSRGADPNTGLYFPTGADTLALAVGGSDAVYIDSNRRVGIGISSSIAATLHVEAAGAQARFSTASAADARHEYYRNGVREAYISWDLDTFQIYGTKSGGSLMLGTNATERLRIKSTGQLNFTGLAADPTGAAGDLYYSSANNVFKYHDGTAWARLPRKYSAALSGDPGTVFTVTHNFNTREVTVQVRKTNSPFDIVYTDVKLTNLNTVTVEFAASVTPADYTVTIIG